MARTDNLTNYLTDVADAIRTKTGSQATIQASSFDTEIEDIETIDDGFVVEDNEYSYTPSSQRITSLQNAKQYAPGLIIKKIPYFEMSVAPYSSTTNVGCNFMFAWCINLEEIDVSGIDVTSNTKNCYRSMFNSCYKLKEIDLSSWGTITGTSPTASSDVIGTMFRDCTSLKIADLRCFSGDFLVASLFQGCTSLEHIDIRGLDFANCTNTDTMLGGSQGVDVPTTCEIIVADTTQKEWFATNYPDYTNVKTVAEYES